MKGVFDMKKSLVAIILVLSMIAGVKAYALESKGEGAEAYTGEPITLIMGMTDGEQTNYYRGAMAIVEEVKKATNGKIIIDVKAGGTLGSETDELDMVIQGDLDIAACSSSVVSNYIPELAILDQAFLWDSQEQANYAIQHELGELLQQRAQEIGFHVIGSFEAGYRDVFSTRPVKTISDFKGLKIRTMQSKGQLQAFIAFGANPVALSFGEQFSALQQGTIDACENALVNCWDNKYYEAGVNSIIKTNHCFLFMPLCMSENAYNRIPENLREKFVKAVWAGCSQQWQYLNEANADALAKLEQVGVTLYEVDLDELKTAYKEQQKKDGTTYDMKWVDAVNAAKTAIK